MAEESKARSQRVYRRAPADIEEATYIHELVKIPRQRCSYMSNLCSSSRRTSACACSRSRRRASSVVDLTLPAIEESPVPVPPITPTTPDIAPGTHAEESASPNVKPGGDALRSSSRTKPNAS